MLVARWLQISTVLASLAGGARALADDPPGFAPIDGTPPDPADEMFPAAPPSGSPPSAVPVSERESESTPSPYVAPFQLRGVVPKNMVKVDTTVAPYQRNGVDGRATVLLVSAHIRLLDTLAVQLRWGFDHNHSSGGVSRSGVTDPTVGALFATPMGRGLRLAISATVGFPLATGGGNNADPDDVLLQKQAALARSAMDNTSFAVNDVGFPLGASLAYIRQGLTAQVDATLIPSVRVKGEKLQTDSSKVSSTSGVFVGYLFIPEFSLGAELRYQRYLSTPSAVEKDRLARDNLTIALGARINLRLSPTAAVRPGLSYGRGVHGLVDEQSFQMLQFDVPVSF